MDDVWNYRILRHRDPLPKYLLLKKNKEHREKYYPNDYIEWFAIHEVFYNKKGKIYGITKDPITVTTETFNKSEFNRILSWMRKAVNAPVIDYNTSKEIKNEVNISCIGINKERCGKSKVVKNVYKRNKK